MNKKIPLKTLIDTGATGYGFIDERAAQDVCSALGIQPNPLLRPKPIRGFDGHLARPITYAIYPSLTIQSHSERTAPLLITRLGQHPMILGKTWLNTYGVLLDMLHDKLIFRPSRCDHDLPTSSEPKEPTQPSPRITQILKRGTPVDYSLSPRSQTTVYPPAPSNDTERLSGREGPVGVLDRKQDSDGNEESATPTSTKKATKKDKKQTTEEPLGESKPVSITMIGAAAFRSLTRKKDVKTFSITPCQIDQMLESLSRQAGEGPTLCAIDPATLEETRAKLPIEYHEFLDIFDRSKADELPPYRSYDHKIELEGEG
jgi:hypothetical protein